MRVFRKLLDIVASLGRCPRPPAAGRDMDTPRVVVIHF
jgi:hypothetical protein